MVLLVAVFDQIAHQCIDPCTVIVAQNADTILRKVFFPDDAAAQCVVDIVVDIGDPVADLDDLSPPS